MIYLWGTSIYMYIIYLCRGECVGRRECMESRRKLSGVGTLLIPSGFQALNSGPTA